MGKKEGNLPQPARIAQTLHTATLFIRQPKFTLACFPIAHQSGFDKCVKREGNDAHLDIPTISDMYHPWVIILLYIGQDGKFLSVSQSRNGATTQRQRQFR
jgi:hypothetical protein